MKIQHLLILILMFSVFSCTQNNESIEAITVKGNQFQNQSGKEMIFHGVNIRDPHQLEKDGLWSKAHFEVGVNWGSNILRLPVHPSAWNERGQENYLLLIDEAVVWARELGVHLIIDWHIIGNLGEEKFQHPMYNTTFKETQHFWEVISKRYQDEPVIAMYELYNEPTVSGEQFGDMSWETLAGLYEVLIDDIRENDKNTIILLAGFNWAYDLTPIKTSPVNRENIAYVSHPYPEKRKQPWEGQWQEDWGYVAEKYPVILTEVGYALPEEKGVHVPVHGDEVYGNALVDFCKERGISWVVWCFDSKWSPLMYTGDYEPTSQGAFFKEVMQND